MTLARWIAELQKASLRGGQLSRVVLKRLVCVGDCHCLLGGTKDIDEVGDLLVLPSFIINGNRHKVLKHDETHVARGSRVRPYRVLTHLSGSVTAKYDGKGRQRELKDVTAFSNDPVSWID